LGESSAIKKAYPDLRKGLSNGKFAAEQGVQKSVIFLEAPWNQVNAGLWCFALNSVLQEMTMGHRLLAVSAFAGMTFSVSASWADIFDIGSSFSVSGTNAPNDFSQTVTLSPGTTTIDSGALTLTQSIVNKPSGEWLVLTYQTTSGLIYAGTGDDWDITASGIELSKLSNGIGFYLDWGADGVLANPTSGFGGIPLLGTNPITGSGTVFGGLLNGAANNIREWPSGTGANVSPFGFLADSGVSLTGLNEFQDAIEVAPAAIPEPGTLALFASGLAGLRLLRRRRAG
jgi:hypothetical protein